MKVRTNNILGFITGVILLLSINACNNSTSNKTGESDSVSVETDHTIADTVTSKAEVVSYPLITPATQIPGTIDDSLAVHLPIHIKALAAFYAAQGGTDCDGENCGLTSALELGKQGSQEQQALIRDYFPEDKVAQAVLAQNCYLRPSGASSFTEFAYLTIRDYGDSVSVDYELFEYNRGEGERVKGPDVYTYKNNVFKNQSRKIWTSVGES